MNVLGVLLLLLIGFSCLGIGMCFGLAGATGPQQESLGMYGIGLLAAGVGVWVVFSVIRLSSSSRDPTKETGQDPKP